MLTNLVEMGQVRDKILSLKLDQVRMMLSTKKHVAHFFVFRSRGHLRRLVWLLR